MLVKASIRKVKDNVLVKNWTADSKWQHDSKVIVLLAVNNLLVKSYYYREWQYISKELVQLTLNDSMLVKSQYYWQ